MSNTSFEKYLPDSTAIYDYISTSLIDEKWSGAWLSEPQAPIIFTCVNCKVSKIDLTKLEFMNGEFPRTSVEKIKEHAGHGFIAWNIRCMNCQSIYEISNGWVEPNNGRMIITLGGVYEIKPNIELMKIALVCHVFNKGGVRKYTANYHKFFLQIKTNFNGMSLSFKIEKLLGSRSPQQAFQIDFYAVEEFKNLKSIIENAGRIVFEALSKEGVLIRKSLGIKLTDIEFSKIKEASALESFEDKKQKREEALSEVFKSLLDLIINSKDNENLKDRLGKNGFGVNDLLTH